MSYRRLNFFCCKPKILNSYYMIKMLNIVEKILSYVII